MLSDRPHRRYNPLTGDWVLVSPHRTERPWQGLEEAPDLATGPEYDPECYLCPGNTRAGGAKNPDYRDTFVFTNDFSALLPGTPEPTQAEDRTGLLMAEPETGVCRVVCFSPRHDLSMARMNPGQVEKVVETWCAEYRNLAADPNINYVQIFENRGTMMGCSNPHPHGQIWANRTVPVSPDREGLRQAAHLNRAGNCLLCEYLETELRLGERMVAANDHFAALVPFWAVWPYEIMILPREHLGDITRMSAAQRSGLADIMIRTAVRYDNMFETAFPYSMGIHQSPTDGGEHPAWHFHLHYYPPLLRSRTVRKHMVGYELLAMPQRDLTAEESARRLRALPEIHYSVQPVES